jgi:hypothetical protein
MSDSLFAQLRIIGSHHDQALNSLHWIIEDLRRLEKGGNHPKGSQQTLSAVSLPQFAMLTVDVTHRDPRLHALRDDRF